MGLSPEAVAELVAPELGGGRAYLVGSLAGGLGNRSSDVDIHVVDENVERHRGPKLNRLDGVPVDIEHFPASAPAELAQGPGDVPVLRFAAGDVALCRPLERSEQRRAARWFHATGLDPAAPPLYDAAQSARVQAMLARVTFGRLAGLACMAGLAEQAGLAEDTRRHLWRQAGRQLLELRCRLAGDVTTGDKWLPVRARRLGLPTAPVDDGAHLRADLVKAGLPEFDPSALAAVRPARGSRTVSLAGRSWLVNRHDRLLSGTVGTEAPVAEAAGELGAARLLDAVGRAELDLVVEDDALRKVFGTWITEQ
ncbi:hypothetical protein ACFUN7_36910 [Streptomyces sp. NPDC057236]|uniref:hypothetical protein n=1 Tax=Streptomyces sp. NPDC057236 TaxID=3346059 RepID=UPI0036410D37